MTPPRLRMPPRTDASTSPDHAVTAVLVSHDGAAWLPRVPRRAAAQTRPPHRVVAVDTGSTDETATCSPPPRASTVVEPAARPGSAPPSRPGSTPSPVRRSRRASRRDEWVWLLHDDSAPGARRAGAAARRAPTPPRGRRPRPEAARVAIAAAAARGRRHDLRHRPPRDRARARRVRPGPARRASRDVLAVNTAGMLVRRDVWTSSAVSTRSCRSSATTSTSAGAQRRGGRAVVAPRAGRPPRRGGVPAASAGADASALPTGAAARAHGMQLVLANTSAVAGAAVAVPLSRRAVLRVLGALLLLRSVSNT